MTDKIIICDVCGFINSYPIPDIIPTTLVNAPCQNPISCDETFAWEISG